MDEQTIIDLKKPADLIMVNRAVCNGWPIDQHVRNQIVEQMHDALIHYQQIEATGGRAYRQVMQILRIVKLMQAMVARNRVDEAIANQSDFPNLRKRPYPEPKRRPRINRQHLRVQAALTHKAAREANNSTNHF